jgi:hypothetical protein
MSDVVERCRERLKADPYYGYERQGTGLHNAYLTDVADLLEEIQRLRKFFEVVFQDQWDMLDPDGGDLQDTAEKLGLLVRVPADDEFKAEWGPGEMLVWAWNPLATKALKGVEK